MSTEDSKKHKKDSGLAFGGDPSQYDSDLYGKGDSGQYSKYVAGMEGDEGYDRVQKKIKQSYGAPKDLIEEAKMAGSHDDPLDQPSRKIADREDKYLQRKKLRMISPPRYDPFLHGDKTPDVNTRTYADILNEQRLENERHDVLIKVSKSKEEQQKKALEKKS